MNGKHLENRKKSVVVVLFDLNKAFDKVPTSIFCPNFILLGSLVLFYAGLNPMFPTEPNLFPFMAFLLNMFLSWGPSLSGLYK